MVYRSPALKTSRPTNRLETGAAGGHAAQPAGRWADIMAGQSERGPEGGSHMSEQKDGEKKYDLAELQRLWKLTYEDLVEAPGRPNARLREARFVMQTKVASETRRYMLWTAGATIVMAIATVMIAVGTFVR